MINYADIIVDLQAGDTGKGKVAHALSKKENEYTHVIRYNGGGNAGHTIYHNGNKFVTHFIPCGVFYGIKSIIGPGCVVNLDKLIKEVIELEKNGVQVQGKLFIDKRVHIITDSHIEEDSKDTEIGTTKTGNGPCYRDKYIRKGLRAEGNMFLKEMLIDIYEELHGVDEVKILFEGAQGFELDIDWGDYPYVTSSHCTVAGALQNGVPFQKVRNVYGIAKAYRTYVGNKEFEKPSRITELIREIGQEYGATTGRPRQIDSFDLDLIKMSININGVTHVIINKLDVLDKVQTYNCVEEKKLQWFLLKENFKEYITDTIKNNCPTVQEVVFSESPYDI
jgi:adenylosuccinate synthase